MSILTLADLAVRAIDTVWSLADDFAPSMTLREAIALAQEVRESILDGTATRQDALLEARIDALRRAHQALSTQAASGDATAAAMATQSLDVVGRRLDVLVSLLGAGPRERDVLGGTLSPGGDDPPTGFRRLAEHPPTASIVLESVKSVAERRLGTAEKQDAILERRARLDERLKVLSELDKRLATAVPAGGDPRAAAAAVATARALQAELDAASFARRALAQRPPQPPSNTPPANPAAPPKAAAPAATSQPVRSAAAALGHAASSAVQPARDLVRSVRRSIPIGH